MAETGRSSKTGKNHRHGSALKRWQAVSLGGVAAMAPDSLIAATAKPLTVVSGVTVTSGSNVASLVVPFSWGVAAAVLVTGAFGFLLWWKQRDWETRRAEMQRQWEEKKGGLDARIKEASDAVRKANAQRSPSRSAAEAAALPADTVSIHHIPFERNPWFTGRATLLERMHAALHRGGGPLALIQSGPVPGHSGLGKSQLAAEYAFKYAREYKLIWWLRASSSATLMADLANLASALGLHGLRDAEKADAALAWLGRNGGWLIVSDDAESLEDLRGRLPLVGKGHLVITSRFDSWEGVATIFDVEGFEPAEAVAFLLKRAGQADAASARDIAALLNNHPLALEMAGSCHGATRIPLKQFAEIFERHRHHLSTQGHPEGETPESVAVTWGFCQEKIHEIAPHGIRLISLLAFLSAEAIPLDLLHKAFHLAVGERADAPAELESALAVLERFGLVRRGEEAIFIHRLVQSAARERLDEVARRTWTQAALRLMDQNFPADPEIMEAWPECRRLLVHAIAAAHYAHEQGVEMETVSRLLHRAAVHLRNQGQFRQARDIAQRAFRTAEKQFGQDHVVVAAQVGNLGRVLHGLNDLEGARQCHQRALEIHQKHHGLQHAMVAENLNDLGLAIKAMGQFANAAKLFEQALEVSRSTLGEDHPLTASCSANLGSVLHDLGDQETARTHFENALRIATKVWGAENPELAHIHRSLGMLLNDMGDRLGARGNLEHALEMFRVFYPESHPNVQRTLTTLKALGD